MPTTISTPILMAVKILNICYINTNKLFFCQYLFLFVPTEIIEYFSNFFPVSQENEDEAEQN